MPNRHFHINFNTGHVLVLPLITKLEFRACIVRRGDLVKGPEVSHFWAAGSSGKMFIKPQESSSAMSGQSV
jgi:hypothetical protein